MSATTGRVAGAAAPEIRRLQITDIEQRIGVERTTVARWIRAGRFPRAERFGQRRVWRVDVIEAWERERLAATQPQEPQR